MMRFSVKRPKKEDFEGMYKLLKELWPEKKMNKQETKKYFFENTAKFLVAKYKNQVVGLSCLRFFLFGWIANIRALIVNNKFRK